MSNPLGSVVFPAAGLGTRILPATKAFPKELLPLVDRPIIQYGVEEAVHSGVKHMVLVTSPDNHMTPAHFSPNRNLEAFLEQRKKLDALDAVRNLSNMADICTVHQKQPLGLGHAILATKELVRTDAFGVVLPDDVIDANPPALQQMIDVFKEVNGPVLLVEKVAPEAVDRYGIVDATPLGKNTFQVHNLVEKPPLKTAPSNLAIVGRYILTSDIFSALERTGTGAAGEIQLTDGIRNLLEERPIYACLIDGTRHDVGNRVGYLEASLHFALKDPELEPVLRNFFRMHT